MPVDRRNIEIEDMLIQVPLFSSLNRKALSKLAKLCVPKEFAAGVSIVKEGKSGLGLFVITNGKVEVQKGSGKSRVILATLKAGDIVGEMSLIDDAPRSATCVAVEATECLLITRESFRTLVSRNADIAWCIVPVLADRVRSLDEQLRYEVLAEHHGAAEAESVTAGEEDEITDGTVAKHTVKDDRLYNMFWSEYALLQAGLEGMSGSIGIMETFLRTLAEETAPATDGRFDKLLETVPSAIRTAAGDALTEGERLPERMVSTYRRERRRR